MLQFVKGRKMENNEPIRDQEIEIDLVALFHELVKHWKALVASMVLLAAVFGLYSKITFVPEYEASAEMYVLTKSTSITSLADIQVGSSLTNDYEYVITGRTVLSQVIDNLDMDETYEQLSKRVSIENPTDTRVLKIVVTDTDLEASKVGALAARLGQDNPGEYMMTGGVAKNKGITNALEEKLGAKLYICDEAQLCGALGAALFAYEKCREA